MASVAFYVIAEQLHCSIDYNICGEMIMSCLSVMHLDILDSIQYVRTNS